MTAAERVLADVRAAGARLEPVGGGKLRLAAPAGAVSAELRAAIAEHKDDLVRLLGAGAHLGAHGWARGLAAEWAPIQYEVPAGCFARTVCPRIGPCPHRASGRPCRVDAGASQAALDLPPRKTA